MDSRERVRLALTCRRPDRVPVALGFFEQSISAIAPVEPEDYFELDVRYVSFEPPVEQEELLRYLGQLPDDVYVGSPERLETYGRWDYHPERDPRGRLNDVQKLEELAEYALPRLIDAEQHPSLTARVAELHRQGLAVVGSPPRLGGELFETAYRLRGFERFLIDLVQRKALANHLLDQLEAILVQSSVLLAESGIDILILNDDVAMPSGLIIGPRMWREFFRSRWARVIQRARDVSPDLLVFYHSDGDFTRLIPDLIDIGVNVINPVQPDCMDALSIKRAYGDRLAMWGTLGTALMWDRGSPEELRAEVAQRLSALASGGGLLMAPAYDIDFAPFENIVAFCEAVREHG